MSGIIHTTIGVAIFWKVKIKFLIASNTSDGKMNDIHEKDANNTKYVRCYMESLDLHIGEPNIHWEDNNSVISVVGSNIVTPMAKHINVPVCFIQEQCENVLFIPKYDQSATISDDKCTRPCSGPIINIINIWMTGLHF